MHADADAREMHGRRPAGESSPAGKIVPWVIAAVVLAGAGAGYYYWAGRQAATPSPAPVAAAPNVAPAAPAVQPEIHYPVPAVPEAQPAARPLPELNDSDRYVQEALAGVFSMDALQRLIVPQELVRHIVATVDNLPRKSVAIRLMPVKPVGGAFRTAGKDDRVTIAPDNAARYAPYVQVAQAVNAKKLVAAYATLYPLFQKAYEDLGYPNAYFNNRLVAVIDHLLAAPDVRGPVALVTPRVQFEYADPELEAASAGQKILIRMGAENAALVKAKLREIRRELTSAGPQS